MELILEAKKALLGTIVALLVVYSLFINRAYRGICSIASIGDIDLDVREGLPDLVHMSLVLATLQPVREGNCRFVDRQRWSRGSLRRRCSHYISRLSSLDSPESSTVAWNNRICGYG